MDELRVQYVFTDEETGYRDAIVLPLDLFVAEYGPLDKLDTSAIDAVKSERVANWQKALEARPEPDLKAEAQALFDEQAALAERLARVTADLEARTADLPARDRPRVR